MVTSGINPEVTVALMKVVGIMLYIEQKTPEMVVRYADFDRSETLEIAPEMAFFTRYESPLDYA